MTCLLIQYPGTKYEGCRECSKIPVEELGSQSCDSDGRLRLEELWYAIVIGHAKEGLGKKESTMKGLEPNVQTIALNRLEKTAELEGKRPSRYPP
jgi:hypothetical protein